MIRIAARDLSVACGVLLLLSGSTVDAATTSQWLARREAQFREWQASTVGTTLRVRTNVQSAGPPSPAAAPPVDSGSRRHQEVWDDPVAPKLVVIAPGDFMMGAPKTEANSLDFERPRHHVAINYYFAVGKYHVTRGEFARFVAETNYDAKHSGCLGYTGSGFAVSPAYDWENPGFRQSESDPVVCVSWRDADAYVKWLRNKTHKTYRLLSEAEWEYAARAGTTTEYWWGAKLNAGCSFVNMADKTVKRTFPNWGIADCDDGYAFTSPAGSFGANPAGLYDMSGNVWQWVDDCWNRHYLHAPADGGAWQFGRCGMRVLRGGAWNDKPRGVRSAYRARGALMARSAGIGFRVARDL